MALSAGPVFETVLYARDLEATTAFYRDVMGLEVISQWEKAAVFRCGPGVLLVFDPDHARRTDRGVPDHGTEGAGHVAFATPAAELEAWRRKFSSLEVPLDREVEWDEGGRSLYVRDPAGNSVELAPATLWGGGWGF